MIEMQEFAPLMFIGLIAIMLLGFPVAFSLSALGLLCAMFAIWQGWFDAAFLANVPLNIFGIMSNELLLAVPFFTLMGALLERCGLAEDMLDSLGQLFGRTKGGIGYSVIIVGFILGAITGTVAGQVIAMAMIALPAMIQYGYHIRYATGVLAASGTITQLVPPSLVLVIMADQLEQSVGDMYKGAWGPSLLQIGLFIGFTWIWTRIRPNDLPVMPEEALSLSGHQLFTKCMKGLVPSALLIFAVLGSMGGLPFVTSAIATPTEAGAFGALGAFGLVIMQKRFSMTLIKEAALTTMRLTAMVIFILIGSRIFSLVFLGVDGAIWIESFVDALPGGVVGFLIAVNVVIFFLSFFLDFFEIAFIIIPLIAPLAKALDINMVWFGVMICVNMQTSFMHPPFGFALFYLRGVSDTLLGSGRLRKPIQTKDIYLGSIPWLCMQLLLVAVVIIFPETVTAFLNIEQVVDIDSIELNPLDSGYDETGDEW